MAYFDSVFASEDLRFQAALANADALYDHQGTRGAQFEAEVRSIIESFLPAAYGCRDGLLASASVGTKQLDLVVHSRSVPRVFERPQLPIELITAAGEVKTRLTKEPEIRATAEKLAGAAAASPRRQAVPFFVLAGSLKEGLRDHARWLAGLVASVSSAPLPWPLWLAAFSFDKDGPMSALRVAASSPIRAVTAGGEILDGVVTIPKEQLSPSAACYLWIWAAIYAADAVHTMDFRFMRDAVLQACTKEGGLEVMFSPAGAAGDMAPMPVSLLLPDDQAAGTISAPAVPPAPDASKRIAVVEDGGRQEAVHSNRWVMLITLGSWVDEPDSWDESAWGGSAIATRRGYGFYPGMTEEELLNACRLFWRFNPESPTWRGIEYAVVAHEGRTQAVVRIDDFIGPFWGRHGFRGHVVTDPALTRELVGRKVPVRRNPVTTIEL